MSFETGKFSNNSDSNESTNNPCNIPLDDFTKYFPKLTLEDECPACQVMAARHYLKDHLKEVLIAKAAAGKTDGISEDNPIC